MERDLGHEHDDLEAFIGDQLDDPIFRAAYEDTCHRNQVLHRLVGRRKERGLSQVVVAERMGTTQSAVSDLESGRVDPRFSTLQRYARAIGFSVDILINEVDVDWRPATREENVEIRPVDLISVQPDVRTRVPDTGRTRIKVASLVSRPSPPRMA